MFKPYNVAKLKDDWDLNRRWQGIKRTLFCGGCGSPTRNRAG